MDGMGKTFFFLIFLFSLLNPYMIRDLEGIWFRWITWSKIQVWLPGYGFWFGIWNEKSYWFKQFQQLGDILGWENDAHHFGAQKVLTRLGDSYTAIRMANCPPFRRLGNYLNWPDYTSDVFTKCHRRIRLPSYWAILAADSGGLVELQFEKWWMEWWRARQLLNKRDVDGNRLKKTSRSTMWSQRQFSTKQKSTQNDS